MTDVFGYPITIETRAILAKGLEALAEKDCTAELQEKIEAIQRMLLSSARIVITVDDVH
ncbi:MAG TPA: hypothetical protein VF760_01975 [Xanthobacteraceae bacterium]